MAKETIDYDKEIEELRSTLTGNMDVDMPIRDKMHNLKMQRDGIKPADSKIDCEGCGS